VSDTAVLIFTAIGFIREDVAVGNQVIINVSLTEDLIGLEEVVVVGYGEQKRSNVLGAVSSVDAALMENKSQLRLDQALQGMAAGVTVARNGGAPGDKPTIHIRGVGSISNTDPLWIVDGVRMDPGNQFDLDDVETIEILKDASSAAIYGAKAAHGVINVTTKRGKGSALQVTFKSSLSKRHAINLPTLLNSADFVKYKKQGRENAGQNPEPSWDNYQYDTDWINAYYAGSGVLQTYDLSVSKGDDKFKYYISFGHDNEKGILIDNSFKRYSVRVNSDVKLARWLTLGESILLSRVSENPISNFNENYAGGIPYRSIPIMPIYDPSNPYGGWGRAPVYFQGPNPVASQYQQHETRTYSRLDGNVYLEARPLPGLQVRGTVGLNYLSYFGEKFDEAFNYGAFANPINALTYSSSNDQTIIGNVVATYTREFNRHNFKIMGGYEASKFDSKHFNLVGNDFPMDVAWSFNLATGAISTTDKFNIYQSRMLSQFGRFNYNYDEKYLFEANIRRDASAPKFGPSNIWGVFPSFSVGWRISQENFFRNVPFITNLKIRASMGKLGSDNIGNYIYLKTYTSQFSTYSFDVTGKNKVSGFYISKFPNEDVKWEEVHMNNIAIDLKAFENKVSISVDYYIKDTKDLLYAVAIPASVGIATHNFDPVNPEINIGTMRNTGIDIDLGYAANIGDFSLNIGGNVSFVKNRMKSLRGSEYITGGSGGGQIGGMTRTQAGQPISSFYGYVVQQMLNSSSDVYAINTYSKDGIYQEAGTAPGDFMYKDISGPNGKPDGKITAQYDRVFLGNPWPKMTYALNINAVYKGMFDLALQFQGVRGVDIFNANKAYTRNFFGDNNTTTLIYDAWTPEHHTNNPRNIASDPNGNFGKPSSYFVEDGSYLKLRNVQVGFTVPRQFLQRWKLNKVRVYMNANNLLTITKYSGFDPEIAGSNTGRGVDYGYYPQVRTYGGGLEVQF
ncbi:MAG TPA: TonB-dependent receptor, partial [Ohtaekwangia sp.]|uniref:SusC/RagA family TonB-linked outer membrane protein n=1 Tax=Ohtaekwangia sp. TaxID=2066019 RepID=UPI002F927D24